MAIDRITGLPGGLVTALHHVLRAHARRRVPAWQGLTRFLPYLSQGSLEEALKQALQRLAQENAMEAQLLHLRFWKGESVLTLSATFHLSPSTIYARQRHALARLAYFLWEMEQERRRQLHEVQAFKLRYLPPPSYTRLFGLTALLTRLSTKLQDPDGPRVVVIEGLGGLGKTTLAHALCRQTLPVWDDILWVSVQTHAPSWELDAQPLEAPTVAERLAWQVGWTELAAWPPARRIPLLRARFGQRRYLVVLDDVLPETAQALLGLLPPPPAETRFLFTSRYHCPLPGLTVSMPELDETASLDLLAYEIRLRGLPDVPRHRLRLLYEQVGGHPLALKLLAGQLAYLPLDEVLANLTRATGPLEKRLFAYIYDPLFQRLPEDARKVLLTMPYFAPSGPTYDELVAVTGLTPTRLDAALYLLVQHGLLYLDAGPPARYLMHRLTYVYLTRCTPSK